MLLADRGYGQIGSEPLFAIAALGRCPTKKETDRDAVLHPASRVATWSNGFSTRSSTVRLRCAITVTRAITVVDYGDTPVFTVAGITVAGITVTPGIGDYGDYGDTPVFTE
jgi:hypothetical protein